MKNIARILTLTFAAASLTLSACNTQQKGEETESTGTTDPVTTDAAIMEKDSATIAPPSGAEAAAASGTADSSATPGVGNQ